MVYRFCLIILLLINNAVAKDIVLVSDLWCPYICKAEDNRPGIIIEIVQEAFKKENLKVRFLEENWARSIHLVKTGEMNALAGAYKSDAPDFIFPESSIFESQMCFFTNKDDQWSFKKNVDLQQRTLLTINGYSYGEKFDVFLNSQNNFINYKISGKENIAKRQYNMLLQKRVDTVLADKNVFSYNQNKANKMSHFKNAGCLPKQKVYIAFSPKLKESKGYAKLLDLGIQKLQNENKIKSILKKYDLSE